MATGFYVGVDGKTRKVKGMYIGIDGKARKVKKGYIGDENGVAQVCWSSDKVTFTIMGVEQNTPTSDFWHTTDIILTQGLPEDMTWGEFVESKINPNFKLYTLGGQTYIQYKVGDSYEFVYLRFEELGGAKSFAYKDYNIENGKEYYCKLV